MKAKTKTIRVLHKLVATNHNQNKSHMSIHHFLVKTKSQKITSQNQSTY